jgi:hypothetical protein
MTTRYIVMRRAAKMPSSIKAPYARVGVVETDLQEGEPKMLSDRARGVVRIVRTWERLHARGVNTALARAIKEANTLAAQLNGALK